MGDGKPGECWSECEGGYCRECGINGYCCSGDPEKSHLNGDCNLEQVAAVTAFWNENRTENYYHTCVVEKRPTGTQFVIFVTYFFTMNFLTIQIALFNTF